MQAHTNKKVALTTEPMHAVCVESFLMIQGQGLDIWLNYDVHILYLKIFVINQDTDCTLIQW